MPDEWKPPQGHPITLERAKELLAGDLGNFNRSILGGSCAPLFWYRTDPSANVDIQHNGTLTIVRTPKRLFGITAAHVVKQYQEDHEAAPVRLQVMNAPFDDPRIIAISPALDLATIDITEDTLRLIGKEIVPLSAWPPRLPQEDRGIMLAGYPGIERLSVGPLAFNFGLFTALGIARRVVGPQITWRVDRDYGTGEIPSNFGGISGGPLIGWFETANYLTHYTLSGIIIEAHQELENVVAIRADYIAEDGSIFESS